MLVACEADDTRWTGDYVTDFQDLLPALAAACNAAPSYEGDTTATAQVESMRWPAGDHSSAALMCQTTGSLALSDSVGATHLARRSFRGLDPQIGQTPVAGVMVGRSGLARGYANEAASLANGETASVPDASHAPTPSSSAE